MYSFFTQPDQLSQWFAEKVDANENEYTFFWGDYEETGTLLEHEENVFAKYSMEGYENGEYLEFRIQLSEISNDTILIVTDFTEKY